MGAGAGPGVGIMFPPSIFSHRPQGMLRKFWGCLWGDFSQPLELPSPAWMEAKVMLLGSVGCPQLRPEPRGHSEKVSGWLWGHPVSIPGLFEASLDLSVFPCEMRMAPGALSEDPSLVLSISIG